MGVGRNSMGESLSVDWTQYGQRIHTQSINDAEIWLIQFQKGEQ